MTDRTRLPLLLLAAAVVLGGVYLAQQPGEPDGRPKPLCPGPDCPNPVIPDPGPDCPGPNCPQPKPRPKPWREVEAAVAAQAAAGDFKAGGPELGGVSVACDLPADRHLRNVGGSDGLGLCVFAASAESGDWCADPVFARVFDWMKPRPGGGWPDKLRDELAACARSLGLPPPTYVQTTAKDVELLREASRNRLMACVTYSGADGVFYRQTIAHMVCLVFFDDQETGLAAILDNNYPGKILWMSSDDFLKRWSGWAVIPLRPGPPPVPTLRYAAEDLDPCS